MAVLTFADCQNKVLRSLDEAGDTGTTLSIVKDYIQVAHNERVSGTPWPFMLWPDVVTFSTVASQRYYGLHQEFGRMLWCRNRTTKAHLRELPFRNLAISGADWNNDTGSAESFIIATRMPVSRQPTTAGVLKIVSSSASDGAGKTVTVRGMTADGVTTESFTANGTTEVTGSTTFSAGGILQITKSTSWVGTMTLRSGSTDLLKLFASEYGRSYAQLEMLQSPTAGETIEYRFFRLPAVLSADNDILDIPPPFTEIVVYDALLLIAGYNSEVSPVAVSVWRDQRDRLEVAMQKYFMEAQTIGAEPRYVKYIADGGSLTPRINR